MWNYYNVEKKSMQRSIRMKPSIYEYVEEHDGDGFNDKLEKMILFFRDEEPLLIKRIEEEKKELETLKNELSRYRRLHKKLLNISELSDKIVDSINNLSIEEKKEEEMDYDEYEYE